MAWLEKITLGLILLKSLFLVLKLLYDPSDRWFHNPKSSLARLVRFMD